MYKERKAYKGMQTGSRNGGIPQAMKERGNVTKVDS